MTAAIPTRHPLRFDTRWMGEVLALAALYFLTALLGLLLAIPGAYVTPVWPPSGIALAAVWLRGPRIWPGIWLGSFAANFWHFYGSRSGLPTELATAATIGIGACLTALLGRHLLRRFVGERNPLERVQDVCAFMALGGVVSCLASATIGVTALCLAGYSMWLGYGQAWVTWWLGDTGGVFIVAPLLLVWAGTHRPMAARLMELFGGFGLMIAVTYYVFCENTAVAFTGKALTFIILIPFLVWAALRTGRRGAAAAVGLIALLAVWGTIHQTGPFNLGTRNEALLLLEMFLAVLALTALCLAAMVTEREQVAAAQQRAVEELESHVRERTSALVQSEKQAYQHLAEAERARAALLSILEDQQQGEENLRESEARLQLLVKSSNVGLWDWNLITNEVFFSPEWKSQLGYADDEVPGRYEEWESRLHPEDRESSLRAVHEFREGRRNNYDIEFRMRHKNGSWRSILTRADLIRDGTGQPVRMMGCHVDITDRKQAEQAKERGLSLMLATLESTADGILVVNTEGKIETFNRLFARMWRLTDEVLASNEDAHALDCVLDQLIEPKKFLEKVRYLYRHPEEESFDRLRFKDGRVFERYSRPQLIGGKVAGRVWSFRDATERRRAAKALEGANERLRFLSRRLFHIQEEERRHLARELHDEIGQTLTAAKINLKIIAPNVPAKSTGRLDDSIQLLDHLLRQVRELSLNLRPPLLDELGLVPTLRWLVDQQAQRAGLRVTFTTNVNGLEMDPDIRTTCFRVAQEAITNVIRHSGAKNMAVELRREVERLTLNVRDDGAGFDPSAIQQRGATQDFTLGLVSMKERALLVRGGFEVHSVPGQGTEIRAWFPLPNGEHSSPGETS